MNRIQSAYQTQLRNQAYLLRQEAETLPRGRPRDALLRQAQRLEQAAVMDGWLSCTELQPPKEFASAACDEANAASRGSPKSRGHRQIVKQKTLGKAH